MVKKVQSEGKTELWMIPPCPLNAVSRSKREHRVTPNFQLPAFSIIEQRNTTERQLPPRWASNSSSKSSRMNVQMLTRRVRSRISSAEK